MRNCLAVLTTLVVNFSMVAFVPAEDAAEPRTTSAVDASRAARQEEKRLLDALARPITFECKDTPLNEAIHQFSEIIERDVLFDAIGLVEEGITMDQEVSLQLGKMSAWQTLHFLLKPLRLTWVANDGVIELTTEKNASEALVTRVYDVRNLCKMLEPLTREMFAAQRRGKPLPPGGGAMGGGGFFSIPATALALGPIGQFGGMAPGNAKQIPMVAKSVEAVLADVIRTCSGMLWEDDGDDVGAIQLGQGCLIVRQSYQGQFEIEGMLVALEQFLDGKVQGKSIAACRKGYPGDDDARIFEILRKPITLQLEEEPLRQVLGQIAQTAGIRLWIDERAISDDGVDIEQPISPRRRMQNLPLAICIKKILEPMRLAFVVEEGVLVVTSRTVAADMMTIRFYDIGGITKIIGDNRNSGVISVLSRSTHGIWSEIDGDGGSAALVSSKHLAVRQTQQVHTEIALLIDDLTKEELIATPEPALELRVYTAIDADTARDFVHVLPQVLGTKWSVRGSIYQAGTSLFVDQPSLVHDRLNEIIQKLEQSSQGRNPPIAAPLTKEPGEAKEPDKSKAASEINQQ